MKKSIEKLNVNKPSLIFYSTPFIKRLFVETRAHRNLTYIKYKDINTEFQLIQENENYNPTLELIIAKEKIGVKSNKDMISKIEEYKSQSLEWNKRKIGNNTSFEMIQK